MYKIQSYSCLLLLTLLLAACQEPDRGPEKRPAPIVPTHWCDGTPIAADYPRDHYGVPYRIGNLKISIRLKFIGRNIECYWR